MVLKVYAYAVTHNAKIVGAILHEKKIPFELVPVDLGKGEHKLPEYLEKHPFGQIPCIVGASLPGSWAKLIFPLKDDDGFILYETRAIARYIEEKYPNQGPKFIPDGVKNRALFEQAASVEYSNFDPVIYTIIIEKIVKPCVLLSHRLPPTLVD